MEERARPVQSRLRALLEERRKERALHRLGDNASVSGRPASRKAIVDRQDSKTVLGSATHVRAGKLPRAQAAVNAREGKVARGQATVNVTQPSSFKSQDSLRELLAQHRAERALGKQFGKRNRFREKVVSALTSTSPEQNEQSQLKVLSPRKLLPLVNDARPSEALQQQQQEAIAPGRPQAKYEAYPERTFGTKPANLKELVLNDSREPNLQFKGEGHHLMSTTNWTVHLARTQNRKDPYFKSCQYQFQLRFTPNSENANSSDLSFEEVDHLIGGALNRAFEWLLEEFSTEDDPAARLVRLNIDDTTQRDRPFHYDSHTYNLTRINVAELVEDCLRQIQQVVQSNYVIPLDGHLLLYLRVLHVDRPGVVPSSTVVGGRKIEEALSLLKHGVTKTRLNCFDFPEWFPPLRNRCLPASLIVCHLKAQRALCDYLPRENITEEIENDAWLFDSLKKLQKGATRNNIKIANHLNDRVNALLNALPFGLEGPFELHSFLVEAVKLLNCQVHVYNAVGNRHTMTVPALKELPSPDDVFTKRQFVMYVEDNCGENGISHIMPILKIHRFFSLIKYNCFYCDKRVNTRHSGKHVCRKGPIKRRVCSSCNCLIPPEKVKGEVYVDAENQELFCLEGVPDSFDKKCDKCSITFRSLKCQKKHAANCRFCVQCPKCEVRMYVRRNGDPGLVLAEHVCGEVTCQTCYTKYVKSDIDVHICPMKPPSYQKFHDYTGFFDIESCVTAVTSSSCEQCALLKAAAPYIVYDNAREQRKQEVEIAAIKCPRHENEAQKEGHHYGVLVVFYFEDRTNRGTFSKVVFASSSLNHPLDCTIEHNAIVNDYIPDCMKALNPQINARNTCDGTEESIKKRANEARRRFLNMDKCLQELKQLQDVCAVTKFVSFLMKCKFENYSIFSINGKSYDSQMILRCAIEQGIVPVVKAVGSKVLCMSIEPLHLRFLDSINYLAQGAEGLARTYNLDGGGKLSFPLGLLKPEYFEMDSDEWPGLEHFTLFNDDDETLRQKAAEIEQHRANKTRFNLKMELYKYCDQDTKILLHAMCAFLKQSYQMQGYLIEQFKPKFPKDVMPYQSPFTNYSTTASFVLGIWKMYCLKDFPLYSFPENAGSRVCSSNGELEFCSYLEHAYGRKIVSKFTAVKPAKFGNYVVDAFDPVTRVCHEYEGCLFHLCRLGSQCGNRPQNLSDSTRNAFGVTFEKMARDRDMREKVLKQQFGITNIQYMPECLWTKAKSTPLAEAPEHLRSFFASVQDFMSNHFKSRPPKRISLRDALKGGR